MPAKRKTAPVKLTANPRGSARVSKKPPLTPAQLKQIDAYWRASNYLTACQLYLLDNPLLERPLTAADLKQTIVGHWGTCPGQNFIYTHRRASLCFPLFYFYRLQLSATAPKAWARE